ncbi:GNAT family N-acetyltransferase [Sphingomonas sp.]|uniref:GNAT family N-acetyltransferase n=1 Tax=Sphingomonas sp. TaxID=28214 RepID=UPI0035C7F7FD
MIIREGEFGDPQVRDLLAMHASGMLANSPVDQCHFLDLSGLQAPDVRFFTLWDGEALVAMGAYRDHGGGLAEIKSMRTVPARLGQGHGRAMLMHILAEAIAAGMTRISLETGSGAAFEAALALYRAHGFVDCPPFADYQATDFNQFLTLDLCKEP